MSVLSLFAGVCAFFSAAMIGLWIKKRLLKKAVFYQGYYDYLLFATEKIGYERMPIGELNANFLKKNAGIFPDYLAGRGETPPLSDATLAEIKEYLSGIGRTDAETQIASLRAKCAEIKRFVEGECVKYRKEGAMYFKLCALLGVVVFIILV